MATKGQTSVVDSDTQNQVRRAKKAKQKANSGEAVKPAEGFQMQVAQTDSRKRKADKTTKLAVEMAAQERFEAALDKIDVGELVEVDLSTEAGRELSYDLKQYILGDRDGRHFAWHRPLLIINGNPVQRLHRDTQQPIFKQDGDPVYEFDGNIVTFGPVDKIKTMRQPLPRQAA